MKRCRRVWLPILLILTFLVGMLGPGGVPAARAADASITSISPSAGNASGGYAVVVTGSNFGPGSTVQIQVGTAPIYNATVLGSPTSTKVTFLMPDVTLGMAGSEQKVGTVIVTNGDPIPTSDTTPFTFYADPTIDGYKRNTDVYFIRDTSGLVTGYNRESQLILTGHRLNQPVSLLRLGGITVPLTDIVASDYSFIQFKVPAGFTDGQVVDVHLETQYGAVVDHPNITLYPTPDISNISRTQVLVGSTLEVTGQGFYEHSIVDLAGGLVEVTLGDPDNEVRADGKWLKIKVPTPLDSTTGKKDLRVTLPDLNDGTHEGQMVTLKSEIEILPTPGELEITSVSPNSGRTSGGTVVQVTGRGFQSDMEVWFGSSQATNVSVVTPPAGAPSGTTILQATTPSGPEGPVNVYVRDPVFPDDVFAVMTNGFTYTLVSEALYVGVVNPDFGEESEGKEVTVTGRNFVRFRSETGSTKFMNGDPFNFATGLPKALSGTTLSTIEEYPVTDPITGLEVDADYIRTLRCTVGGNYATLVSITRQPTTGYWILTIKVPTITLIPRQEQSVDVVVSTTEEVRYHAPAHDGAVISGLSRQEQEKAENQFTYKLTKSEPEINTVTPALGSTAGGTTVVVDGWDFQSNVEVYFGTRTPACRATVTNIQYLGLAPNNKVHTVATVTTPSGAARGDVDVIVYNPIDEGEGTLTNGFKYISNPTITTISPAVSPLTGGVLVTVTGTDFLYDAVVQVGAVTIPDEEVRVIASDGTRLDDEEDPPGVKIKFYTPPQALGSYDLTIINPDTGTVTKADAITYKDPDDNPQITSIDPNEGPTTGGTDFTISGNTFGGPIMVTFDGEPATGIQVSSGGSRITGRTPAHAVPGEVDVQVLNTETGGLATLSSGFTYRVITSDPRITSFTPNHGEAGTLVHIVGTDFVKGGGGVKSSRVYFGDTVVEDPADNNDPTGIDDGGCGIYVVSDTLIEVRVPNLGSAGDYTVRVVNPDTATATASGTFRFQVPVSDPEIISITPNSGSYIGGGVVLIEGLDFRTGCQVYFGEYAATVLSLETSGRDADTGKWVTVAAVRIPAIPMAECGFKDVVLMNPDGGTDLVMDGFQYKVPVSSPSIISVTPNSGSGTGGYDIEIFGQDFRNLYEGVEHLPTVYIGTTPATVLSFTDSIEGQTLTVLVPPSATSGPRPVVVVNYDGGVATLNNGFTYTQSRLSATTLIPATADKAGDTVINLVGTGLVLPSTRTVGNTTYTVRGTRVFMETDFSGTMEEVELDDTVNIDGTDYNRVEVLSDTHLRLITVEQGTVGTRTLRLLNPDGAEDTIDVTIVSPIAVPTITEIDPTSGTLAGGTLVTITGTDFRPQAKVYIGVREAEVVSRNDDGEIVISTPAGTTADLGVRLDVIVVNVEDGGSYTLIEGWAYIQPESAPTIISVTPNTGPEKGGTRVTIVGTNFRPNAEVYFGTLLADDIVQEDGNYTTITCKTPPQAAGVYDVVVRNSDFGQATLPDGFTYVADTTPAAPTGFIARLVADRCIELSWDALGTEGTYTYEIYASTEEYFIDSVEDDDEGDEIVPDDYYFKVPDDEDVEGADGVEIRVSGSWVGFDEITLLDDDTYEYDDATHDLLGARIRVHGHYYQVDRTSWSNSTGIFRVTLVRDGDYDNDDNIRSDDEINDAELQFIGSTRKTHYTMNRVRPDTDYYFVLHAVGSGKASIWVQADPYPLSVERLERIGETDEDDYEYEEDLVFSTIDLQKDSLNITIGSQPRTETVQDYLELTDNQYGQVKQVRINIPDSILTLSGRSIYVDTSLGKVSFAQNALYTSEIREAEEGSGWASGIEGALDIYGRLIMRTLKPAEVERATARLGSGYQLIGGIELLGEAQANTRVQSMQGLFNFPVNLTLKAASRQWSGAQPGGVYYFDESTRVWVETSGTTNPSLGTGSVSVIKPGRYALIIKRY
ncbi:MAG: hypothetical protein HPY50_08425 [Firmicutes bacterium]|nr:hypothetical protein [Bacillota bacterium]